MATKKKKNQKIKVSDVITLKLVGKTFILICLVLCFVLLGYFVAQQQAINIATAYVHANCEYKENESIIFKRYMSNRCYVFNGTGFQEKEDCIPWVEK